MTLLCKWHTNKTATVTSFKCHFTSSLCGEEWMWWIAFALLKVRLAQVNVVKTDVVNHRWVCGERCTKRAKVHLCAAAQDKRGLSLFGSWRVLGSHFGRSWQILHFGLVKQSPVSSVWFMPLLDLHLPPWLKGKQFLLCEAKNQTPYSSVLITLKYTPRILKSFITAYTKC